MVFVTKIVNYLPGVLVTLIPGIMRGRAMAFILFHILNPNKTEKKVRLSYSFCYYFHLFKQKVNVILTCASARYLWLKLANI